MGIKITAYSAISNIGSSVDEIYNNALSGLSERFRVVDNLTKNPIRVAYIDSILPEIEDYRFNTKANRLILHCLNSIDDKLNELFKKYDRKDIGVIAATTASGVEEFEKSKDRIHSEFINPALFVKEKYGLSEFYLTASSACSSGIQAFDIACDMLNSGCLKAFIIAGVDAVTKVPLYGFSSLEVLSGKKTNPFSKNHTGINIGEAACCFILERDIKKGIEILSISQTTDTYHITTPNPNANEAIDAIKKALNGAKLKPSDINYINLHATGTLANDTMEAKAISGVFNNIPSSGTKQLTGHCLGAAASIETVLLCSLLDNFKGRFYPHIFDNQYNPNIEKIRLVERNEEFEKCNYVMNNSFGFGGANAIMILKGADN